MKASVVVEKIILFFVAILISVSFLVLTYLWIVSPSVEQSVEASAIIDMYRVASYINLLSLVDDGDIYKPLRNTCDIEINKKVMSFTCYKDDKKYKGDIELSKDINIEDIDIEFADIVRIYKSNNKIKVEKVRNI